MADDDAESIGGISVSIGASHARLPGDLAAADRIIENWAKDRFVTIRAQVVLPPAAQAVARPAAAPSVVVGPAARTAVQAQQGQTSFQRAIQAELAKTGERLDDNGEIVSATTTKIKSQKTVIAEVQQAASQPTALNIDTGALQNDLNSVLTTLREIVTTAKEIGTLPAARITASGPTAAATSPSVTARDRAVNTDLATRIVRGQSAEERKQLQSLSAQNQALNVGAPTSATFAPPLTQARRAELLRRGRLEASSGGGSTLATPSTLAAFNAFGGEEEGGPAGRGLTPEDQERRTQARIAVAQAQAISSARTPHTLASSLGGFFGGGLSRERIIATADLSEKEQTLRETTRQLVDVEDKYGKGSNAAAKATEEQTVAQNEYAQALSRVEKLSTGGAAVRNLLAISAAGAAFSVGMKAVDVVIEQVAKGFNEFFEIQTGFGATSTRVTTALGAQTLALHGNVDAALAAAEAQAGLSAASADALNTQLKLTTQIKAGAAAQQQASELFRAGFGIGNAPSGLFGSYGGVLGTGLFGQKGFTQQVQTDLSAFQQPRGGFDILGNFSRGVDYAFNGDQQQAIARLAVQQGQQNPLQALGNIAQFFPGGGSVKVAGDLQAQAATAKPFQQTQLSQEGVAYLKNLNDAAQRGAQALNETAVASYRVAKSQAEVDQATQAAAAAGDQFGVTLAQQQGIILAFGDAIAGATSDANKSYQKAAEQAAVGVGIADPATLARQSLAAERQREREAAASIGTIQAQQAYALPSIIGQISRTQQYAAQVQQPTQFTLQALTNPNLPVGTGIAPEDQAKVAKFLGQATDLQKTLNTEYAQGQQIIDDTYRPAIIKNFGAAAGQAFDTALAAVTSTGKQIAQIQAGISNEQAAYQVAQYNFQLLIAKRTLSDIAGLTDHNFGVGQSQLGVLERQNLLLSREGQQLQFALSQRQINYQVAVAGFSAPGVTPEERQANIAEAKLEASYAQKQLDIQRQMFGNQVKIVDISNLRQGTDLLRQLGLLQQGRKVTLDTTAAQQALDRLNQQQSKNVAQVTTYLSAVDNLASTAIGQIAQIEAAAGKAMANVAVSILGQFGIFFGGVNQYLAAYNKQASTSGQTTPGGHPLPNAYASGGVIGVSGPTRIGDNAIAGEAGNETLLVLAHPRSAEGFGQGGQTVVINFNGPVNANRQSDLDYISRAVLQSLGRTASTLGLRTVG